MEITYQKGAPLIWLVKYVGRDNFPIILYKIAENMLQRGRGTDWHRVAPTTAQQVESFGYGGKYHN